MHTFSNSVFAFPSGRERAGQANLACALIILWFGLIGASCHAADTPPPVAAPLAIAVINSASTADLAALITTELSTDARIHLVERGDLAKVGDERKLQEWARGDSAALGKLIGASGLLFIDQEAKGYHVRFTAVRLGYALFDDNLAVGVPSIELAKSIAQRVRAYLPKLPLDPGQAIPISVLNLRAEIGSAEGRALERNLTLLVESRLSAVPELVVLERRHAWSVGFERSLEAESSPFLRGAHLVDGLIVSPGADGKCFVTLRLRQRGDGAEKSVRVEGSTHELPVLAKAIVAAIQANLGRDIIPLTTGDKQEGNEYLLEALWGLRSGVPGAALEAVESAEMLGAVSGDFVPLRALVLCTLAEKGMESWYPGVGSELPKNVPALEDQTTALLRAIPDAARCRAEKLEDKAELLAAISASEQYQFRTGRMIGRTVVTGSKLLILLEQQGSPRADELRRQLRTLTGYDPLHGEWGRADGSFMANNLSPGEVFADDWAETLDEELAWLRLKCVDTELKLPANMFQRREFCARFLVSPERCEKACADFIESLKGNPASTRAYLIFKTHDQDPKAADAAYLAYIDYLWPFRDELGKTEKYSPLTTSTWRIPASVVIRNSRASLPLVHAVLNAENPGRCGRVVFKNLWRPELTDAADAPLIWREMQGYLRRRHDISQQLEGRSDAEFISDMNKLTEVFKTSFPAVTGGAVEPVNDASSLLVHHFWHPWLEPGTPADKRIYFTSHFVHGDWMWVSSFCVGDVPGLIFKIHLPDLVTQLIRVPDQRGALPVLEGRTGLYTTIVDESDKWGFRHLLARYDAATATWIRRELPFSFSGQNMTEVNGDLYLALENRSDSSRDRETGIARYNWTTEKATVLADNRRKPAINQFDDTADYRIIRFFAGPGNKPCVTTDTGTFYVMDTPGKWPEVFDGRFHDNVITNQGLTLICNYTGEATFIDPRLPAPIPWMAADEPIYRKPKGSAGTTGPVSTPWADKVIFTPPPGRQKAIGEGNVALRENKLVLLSMTSKTEGTYELLCYDKAKGRQPIHVPLKLKLEQAEREVLAKHPGTYPTGWKLEELERPRELYQISLQGTAQGLCLMSTAAGFWFIPYPELDAYLSGKSASSNLRADKN